MLELGFISSSRVKLAHFDYMARMFGVRIYGFRKLTYWGSYDEPEAGDREAILRESYASALKKWIESGQAEDKFFFFEDTSVIIDALSSDRETPGTSVKFWMQKTSFRDLDNLIGTSTRRASIRSDIVLHLPKKVQAYLKRGVPYHVTNSIVSGLIANSPSNSSSAPALYPWLDPRSFSGWFIPDGAQQVLSDLPIDRADKYDFRVGAFKAIVEFLRRLHIDGGQSEAGSPSHQRSLFEATNRTIVILCGHSCAGKTTAGQVIAGCGDAIHLEASDFMRTAMIERLGPISRIPIQVFAEQALREQPWIVPEQILAFITKMPDTNFVISGLRSLAEVQIVTKGTLGSETKMFYITATEDERYRRSLVRNRGAVLTREAYHSECERQDNMGLADIASNANFELVENAQSLEEWLQKAPQLVSLPKQVGKNLAEQLLETGQLTSLQVRCIIALGKYADGFSYYTSGEITKFINADSVDVRTTNDNVSRFLNQSAYPFFEPGQEAKAIGWRLSNTGKSMYRTIRIDLARSRDKPTENRGQGTLSLS